MPNPFPPKTLAGVGDYVNKILKNYYDFREQFGKFKGMGKRHHITIFKSNKAVFCDLLPQGQPLFF